MHNTLSPKFNGYVDNMFVENGNLRFAGWLVTDYNRDDVTYFIDIGHNVAFYNYNDRQDVLDFYKGNPKYAACGFDISIPVGDRKEFAVFAIVNSQREEIFKLNLNERRFMPEHRLANETSEINLKNTFPNIIVVDDFYDNPEGVRAIALQQSFEPDIRYHKGKRTQTKFIAKGTKQVFESLLGRKITNFSEHGYNGIFQYCTAEDPLVYHCDTQSYAAAVYLTPNAPLESGTSFYRSKSHPEVRRLHADDPLNAEVFAGGYYDKTKFELIDTIGNVFNRLVIWDARAIHSASQYFGTNKENSRLFHLFFFDVEE